MDDHPFILGAEDQITVPVYGSPEFSGAHMIRPDGKITMPFLGDVVAAGITPMELSTAIKEKLKKYIVDPDVSVSVQRGQQQAVLHSGRGQPNRRIHAAGAHQGPGGSGQRRRLQGFRQSEEDRHHAR